MKFQANKTQKTIYILFNIITPILIINFIMFGFPLGLLFNLSPIGQVLLTFSSLFIGSYTWAEIITFKEQYIY